MIQRYKDTREMNIDTRFKHALYIEMCQIVYVH